MSFAETFSSSESISRCEVQRTTDRRLSNGWRCCCRALPVYLTMGGLHLGLGLVLKLYFFHYW